jgi:hypothetical protein
MIEHIDPQHLHPGPDIRMSHLKFFENSLMGRIRTHAMAMRAHEPSRDPFILWAAPVHLCVRARLARAFQALQTRMPMFWIILPANSTNPIGSRLYFPIISD